MSKGSNESSPPESAANEDGANSDPPATSEPDSTPVADTSGPNSGSVFARAAAHPLIAGVLSIVIVAILATTWQKAPVVVDNVRDFFRSYDSAQIDDLEESILDRPYWIESPKLLDKSVDFLAEGERVDSLLSVNSDGTPLVVYPANLNEKPYRYEGLPVILVGRIVEASQLPGDYDFLSSELKVTGPKSDASVYVGLTFKASLSTGSIGDLVVLQGVATGVGRTRDSSDVGVTTYFTATDAIDVSLGSAYYQSVLEAFAKSDKP